MAVDKADKTVLLVLHLPRGHEIPHRSQDKDSDITYAHDDLQGSQNPIVLLATEVRSCGIAVLQFDDVAGRYSVSKAA